jgi:hypothetical protein
MANTLNYIIIIIVIVLGYMIYKHQESLSDRQSPNKDLYEEEDYSYLDDIFDNFSSHTKKSKIDEIIYKIKQTGKPKKFSPVNPYFIDMKVHNDYRDTITSFNNVAPDQRPLFNRSMLPVQQIDVNPITVKPLVKAFIKRINNDVKYNITEELNAQSGWDELAEERKMEIDGWGRQQKELGLPEDLHWGPAVRAKIRLIKIDSVEKFVTEDQINFIVHMIIQKKNVEDQMIVKVSYIMDNIPINADRNFNDKDAEQDYNVRIEEIAVIGFLTNYQYGDPIDRKDFYHFTNIEKDDMVDQELLLKVLKEKYRQRQIESDGFNISIAPAQTNDMAVFRMSSETPYKPIESGMY